jgi:Holliday junction resolvasome RuvABC ATP-dependent DNA helicase subunit
MSDGTFGLTREATLADSKVRTVFTPFAPINVLDHFFGREKEVSQLVSVINSPGQHVLLYGDRGVGKTSLATIACRLLQDTKVSRGKFFAKSCDSEDTLASIVQDPLRYTGVDYEIAERTQSHTESGDVRVKLFVADGGVAGNRTTTVRRIPEHKANSPSWVADRLAKVKALFLIDEADALSRKADRKKLAELIKLLSDAKSDFKVMIVGIASTGEELTAGHPSVERCLKETHLSRMADDDLRDIVINGMEKLKLQPTPDVIETIVSISAGYPHFTHLICLKCAENAIVARERVITDDSLGIALRDAVSESEGVLKRRYERTMRGTKHEAEYVSILETAAQCSSPEFTLCSLHANLESRLGVSIPSRTLSRFMANLIESGSRGVFIRVGKGIYRFSDPRMASFVKMIARQEDP